MKKLIIALAATSALAACSDADVASKRNLSESANDSEVTRRIVFYNRITGDYVFTLEGPCSVRNSDKHGQLSVTCACVF